MSQEPTPIDAQHSQGFIEKPQGQIEQGIGATAIAKQLGIGRSTVYQILKDS